MASLELLIFCQLIPDFLVYSKMQTIGNNREKMKSRLTPASKCDVSINRSIILSLLFKVAVKAVTFDRLD